MGGSMAAASQGTFDVTLGCLMSTPLPRLVHASGQVLKATAVYRVKPQPLRCTAADAQHRLCCLAPGDHDRAKGKGAYAGAGVDEAPKATTKALKAAPAAPPRLRRSAAAAPAAAAAVSGSTPL
ncbi:hypothetical protein FOA52_015637 [Chlamydomonas sp. UWO 241]|nr:hypothetical protein FOA52_015637 [Chlamydomonas sp. UWO 241]